MAEPVPLIEYDAARQQLEGGAAVFLAGLAPELVAAGLPAVGFKRGEVAVEFTSQLLTPADFFPLLDVVGPYFRELHDLHRAYRGCTFNADLYTALDRRRNERPPRKIGRASCRERVCYVV